MSQDTSSTEQTTGGRLTEQLTLDDLRFDERGLIPVVCQNVFTGTVLMVAWADRDAVAATESTRRAHFFSRSRQQSWRKGETSGNELIVHEVRADCDRDTLLYRVAPVGPACHTGLRIYRVAPVGPACHTGLRSCFDAADDAVATELELGWLRRVVEQRAGASPESSYTARLLERGVSRIAQKVGEEGVETALAAVAARAPDAGATAKQELIGELADLMFHSLVLMQACDIDAEEVATELERRHLDISESAGVSESADIFESTDVSGSAT